MYELGPAVSLGLYSITACGGHTWVVLLQAFPLQTLTLAWTAAPLSLIFKTSERRVLPLCEEREEKEEKRKKSAGLA